MAADCSYGPWVTWTYWGYRELVESFAFFIPAAVLKKNQVQQAWLNAGLKPVAFISVVRGVPGSRIPVVMNAALFLQSSFHADRHLEIE